MKLPLFKVIKTSRWAVAVTVIGLLVLIIGGASAYAEHSNALPGSALYPLKQVWEKGQVFFSFSPTSKAQTQLNIAQDRIKAVQSTQATTSQAIPALQNAQQHLSTAQEKASSVTDPTKRKELEKSISDTATEAENEVQHESESGSSSSTDKQDLQNTSDQIKQIQTQASSDD